LTTMRCRLLAITFTYRDLQWLNWASQVLASTTLIVSFIVSFGVVKACANLISGQLADSWGRKRVLVLGWLVGLPVPFIIMWAPHWEWIVAANALLGVNQGFAWSMTVIMKIDLVGPKSRGLAVGINEFAGYLAVGITAFLTGYIAQRYGLRPAPIYLGVAYAHLRHGSPERQTIARTGLAGFCKFIAVTCCSKVRPDADIRVIL
jgi:MFS family permease